MNLGQQLILFQFRRVDPFVEIPRSNPPRASLAVQLVTCVKRHHDGRIVVPRVSVRAVATNGAAVPHLGIRDHGRRFRQDPAFFEEQVGC